MKSKKYFGVFLSLLMIVSFMLQGLHAPAHAAELGSNVITSASIAKIDGSPMTGTMRGNRFALMLIINCRIIQFMRVIRRQLLYLQESYRHHRVLFKLKMGVMLLLTES